MKRPSIDALADLIAVIIIGTNSRRDYRQAAALGKERTQATVCSIFHKRMTSLYDKLPADTRDAILTEAAAFSTMLEGDDANAARLMEKAAKLRDAQQTPDKDGQLPHTDRSK